MHVLPSSCPLCNGDVTVTKIYCRDCDSTIEGRFTAGVFSQLTLEQLGFVETFVRCEGKITRVEAELGLSYPTIRNRLHEVIRALGYEPGEGDTSGMSEAERREIFERLEKGEISYEDAMQLLDEKRCDMSKKSIETSVDPTIVVELISSDLNVKGWDRPEVLLKSSSDNDLILEERDGQIIVNSPSDCVLYVPYKASLEVGSVGKNARFKALGGEISIQSVSTDLVLRDVGATTIGSIGTDLSAKRIRGDLKVNSIGANAVIRDVDGQFGNEMIGGQLHLRDVSGGISAHASGNVSAEFSPVPWQIYSISAGGGIRCRVPGDANADFEIVNGAQEIRIKTLHESLRIQEGEYSFKLGDGGVQVKLTAGSSVSLRTSATDFDDFERIEVDFGAELGSLADEIAEQAASQVEAQLDMINSQLDTHLSGLSATIRSSGLSEERAKEVQERLERAKEHAATRAEAAAERARNKLELKVAAAQRKVERKTRAAAARAARKERRDHGERGFTVMSAPHQKPVDPVSEQERMMILNMLQDKKISVEQAEKLLSALEGKAHNMVSESERTKILEMIETSVITAEEGMTLLKALEEAPPIESEYDKADMEREISEPFPTDDEITVEYEANNGETEPLKSEVEVLHPDPVEPPSQEDMDKWKRWWAIPLWIGAGITAIAGLLMFWAFSANGFGFWFACSWFPFLLGVGVLALAWGSKTAPWLHVRVQQSPGETPQRIAISFPIPVQLTVWGFRLFGRYIPNMEGVNLEEIILALKDVAKDGTPFFVNVDEGENGEKVQVFIG